MGGRKTGCGACQTIRGAWCAWAVIITKPNPTRERGARGRD
jgi:hypothetical protein